MKITAGAPVYAIAGSKDLVTDFGFGDGCVVRWNPSSSKVIFTLRVDGASSFDEDETVVGTQDMVLGTSSNAMIAVNLATGEGKELKGALDQQAAPAAIIGRTLLATTTTTRGTTKGGIAAWNLDTAQRIWGVASPKGAQPVSGVGESDALFDGSPRSILVVDGGNAHLLVFAGDRSLSSQTIDLRSGDLGTPTTATIKTSSGGTPSMTVESVGRSRVIVSMDSLLESISIDGRDIHTFPS